MDATKEDKINYATLCKLTTELANSSEFSFVSKLNSMARQASAERAWFSISRFYDNCKKRTARAESNSASGRSKKG
jgi:putative transposase